MTPCPRDRELCANPGDVYDSDSNSSGGVIIAGTGGKIDINNTFDERLKILETDALPSIRVTLFGDNQNRKFRD